jgi:hypothetical protein
MRKFIAGVAFVAALAIPASVTAASLHAPHLGSGCPTGFVGTFHFVNNQTGGVQTPGTLTATIGGVTYVVTAYQVNQNVQHFLIEDAAGAISAASTGALPGNLVLSDLTCTEKK